MAPAPTEPEWHEGAGGLLLLAAAHQTQLLVHLETALQLTRRREKLKVRGKALYAALNARQNEFEQAEVMSASQRMELKAQKATADAELDVLRDLEGRAYTTCNQEFAKCARYCHQQRVVLRQLEDLHAKERKMVELDNRKDQVMTVLKVALSIVGMWVRDQYFPAAYL